MSIKSCLNCSSHEVINDPDPLDWFCVDDMAIICKEKLNDNQDPESIWTSNRNKYKSVTCSCRPYNLEKESGIPDWCPKGLGK